MSDPPPVHLYVPPSRLRSSLILCGKGKEENPIHATEFGPQVTCPSCRALMHGLEPEPERDNPWA